MEKKICTNCGIEKDLSEFGNRKSSNGKVIKNSNCRECLKEKQRQYREKNKDTMKAYDKKRYEDNKETNRQRAKNYYQENKEIIKEKQKNSPKAKEYRKEYYKANKEKLDKQNRDNFYKRLNKDVCFKLKHNISTNLRKSLKRKNHYKKSRSQEILGCTFDEFKQHIESQFEDWMNWDNYGKYNGEYGYGWDIDHIIPTSSVLTENEILELFHFSNLQPLCSKINRDEKKAKINLDN